MLRSDKRDAQPALLSEPAAPTRRTLAWLLFVAGSVGVLAATVLTVEKLNIATDPTYLPSCDLNPILSCGTVMKTWQASLFGIPNSLIGIAGFAAVTTIGAALLARADFGRWFWVGLQVGVTAGAVFVHWLIFQSLYVIGALCPYCMVVWAVTMPIFWSVTVHNLQAWDRPPRRVSRLAEYTLLPLTLWFAGLVTLIALRFWDFWVTLA